ncbi:pectin lyase fold/virulence factor [Vibrio phage 2.275.O._10N.286.54.E11]|nr:pectin lyase fold/virulence factor [Vibrio phage 2.275.O._10N.286.54.E11]
MNTAYGVHRDGSGNLQNLQTFLNQSVVPQLPMKKPGDYGAIPGTSVNNTTAIRALLNDLSNGDVVDFGGNVYRVYADVDGIPSTGAGDTDSLSQNEVLWLDSKKNIKFQNGGLYNADQSVSPVKMYYPTILSLTNCENIHFDNFVLESKGENWGDSDASRTLTQDRRLSFLATNGGHALYAGLCNHIYINNCQFRLAGSVSPLYISMCANVHISDSFSNPASLGYASIGIDGWVGSVSDIPNNATTASTYLSNFVGHKETLVRREDGVPVGSSQYSAKGWVNTEDSVEVFVTGGQCSDMYGNATARTLGYAFGIGSGSRCTATAFEAHNVACLLHLFWSIDDLAYANLSNFYCESGLYGVVTDSVAFGDGDVILSNGVVNIDGSRVWDDGGESEESSHFICRRDSTNTVNFTLNNIEVNKGGYNLSHPFSLVWANDPDKYQRGKLVFNGGHYEPSGYISRVQAWGGSEQGEKDGLIMKNGCVIRDRNAIASDTPIYWGNQYTSGALYNYVDLDDALLQTHPSQFRNLANGSPDNANLVDGYWMPHSGLENCYTKDSKYHKRFLSTDLEFDSSQGLSGTDSRMRFKLRDNRYPHTTGGNENVFIGDDTGSIQVGEILTDSVSGSSLFVDFTLAGDVRVNFTPGVNYRLL